MKTIAACVPSSHVCTPINRAFRKFGIQARAFSTLPAREKSSPQLIEHLPCPIEPATKASLWIVLCEEQEINAFFEQTFLNEEFVQAIIQKTKHVDDKLSMECLMAACVARPIAMQCAAKGAAKAMYKTAKQKAADVKHQHLAEAVLGIPSLADLLAEFVESLLAGSAYKGQASHC